MNIGYYWIPKQFGSPQKEGTAQRGSQELKGQLVIHLQDQRLKQSISTKAKASSSGGKSPNPKLEIPYTSVFDTTPPPGVVDIVMTSADLATMVMAIFGLLQ